MARGERPPCHGLATVSVIEITRCLVVTPHGSQSQVRQLGDVGCDATGFVASQELGRRPDRASGSQLSNPLAGAKVSSIPPS
jgi:hypothetical protein